MVKLSFWLWHEGDPGWLDSDITFLTTARGEFSRQSLTKSRVWFETASDLQRTQFQSTINLLDLVCLSLTLNQGLLDTFRFQPLGRVDQKASRILVWLVGADRGATTLIQIEIEDDFDFNVILLENTVRYFKNLDWRNYFGFLFYFAWK